MAWSHIVDKGANAKPYINQRNCGDMKNDRILHACKVEGTITFPKQTFYPERRFATKEEECIRKKHFCMIPALNDSSKRIDSVAKVSVSTYDVDFGKLRWVRIFKHGAPP